MAKEARRLRDFLENYDDEKDDRLPPIFLLKFWKKNSENFISALDRHFNGDWKIATKKRSLITKTEEKDSGYNLTLVFSSKF